MNVRPKKHLGQHFLRDENIARKVADSLRPSGKYTAVLEVGPGMGMLTKYLLQRHEFETWVVEVDNESVKHLRENFPALQPRIIEWDFLRLDLAAKFKAPVAVIGNFPYNISSQILFHVLEFRDCVPEAVGMFQKEVAERIAAKPGSKTYGILSVLVQAWYNVEYLFTVSEHVFSPPPKVKSAVIRLVRNDVQQLDCDEKIFKEVVKSTFNQRRKKIRNTLGTFEVLPGHEDDPLFSQRPEKLSVDEFVKLVKMVTPK